MGGPGKTILTVLEAKNLLAEKNSSTLSTRAPSRVCIHAKPTAAACVPTLTPAEIVDNATVYGPEQRETTSRTRAALGAARAHGYRRRSDIFVCVAPQTAGVGKRHKTTKAPRVEKSSEFDSMLFSAADAAQSMSATTVPS